MAPMVRQSVDWSTVTHLPICECGWRGAICLTRMDAWQLAANHGRTVHNDSSRATEALRQSRKRSGGHHG